MAAKDTGSSLGPVVVSPLPGLGGLGPPPKAGPVPVVVPEPKPFKGEPIRSGAAAKKATPKVIEEVTPNKVGLTVTGENSILPILFGRVSVQPFYGAIHSEQGNDLWIMLIWGKGEVSGFVNVYADGKIIGVEDMNIEIHNYVGNQTQNPDSWLSAGYGIPGFADNMRGICYSVVHLNSDQTPGLPQFEAVIDGMKIYDPIATNTTFTRNPIRMYRYAATQMGLAIDDANIIVAINAANETVGARLRREANLVIDDSFNANDMLSLLAEAGGCYHFIDGNTARLIPDRPGSAVMAFSITPTGAERAILENSLNVQKLSSATTPNYTVLEYTNTSTWPWRTDYVYPGGFPAGDVIPTRISASWIHSRAQAVRDQKERELRYRDINVFVQFTAFDDALALEVGDIFTITTKDVTAKLMRAIRIEQASVFGWWDIEGEEYSPTIYSDFDGPDIPYPDTFLPDPSQIPAGPTPNEVREVLFTDETGITHTRFEVRFTGVVWAFVKSYRIEMAIGTTVVMDVTIAHQGNVEHVVATPPTAQGIVYTVRIWVISVLGQPSATPGTLNKTGNGKTIPPTNPSFMEGREANQMVALNWGVSVDSDLRGYQIKRLLKATYDAAANNSDRWSSGEIIVKRIDATRVVLDSQTIGEFYYMVKAEDFAGNFSVDFASKLVRVTADQSGASINEKLQPNYAIDVNMHYYATYIHAGAGGGDYGTAGGDVTWEDKVTNVQQWDAFWTTSTTRWTRQSGFAAVYSTWWDTGADKNGNWSASAAEFIATDGFFFTWLELATEAGYPSSTFVALDGNVNYLARYARYVVGPEWPGGPEPPAIVPDNDWTVKMPFDITFHGIRVFDQGVASVPLSGQPLVVNFAKTFSSAPTVTCQLKGATAGYANPDNVTLTGFELHCWDELGNDRAGTVNWTADGA